MDERLLYLHEEKANLSWLSVSPIFFADILWVLDAVHADEGRDGEITWKLRDVKPKTFHESSYMEMNLAW